MTCRVRSLMVLALILVLTHGCAKTPETQRHAFFAVGTLVEITVFDPPENISEALRATEVALLAEEQRWRAWGNGELAEVNRRLSAGDTVELDAALLAGINRARDIAARSRGHFNPAIGRVVEAWGFNSEERPVGPPPTDQTLVTLLPPPSLNALRRDDNGHWITDDSRLWIDMGAFAKGLAVETAIETLQANGVRNAIVNAGGDLKTIGRHGERAWRIGVRHPRGNGVLAALEALDNESVFTSGDYERFFEWKGERFHHVIDPATARPARGVTSVTIVHADAALADAAATALFVAGANDWQATARALGIDKAMLVLDDGRVMLTPDMQSRITFEDMKMNVEVIAP